MPVSIAMKSKIIQIKQDDTMLNQTVEIPIQKQLHLPWRAVAG